MLVKVSLLVALANTLVSVVSGSPVAETNAQRMARGLPPNPPSQFARGVSPVWAAKRTEPSTRPSTCYPGKIEVRYDFDGHVAGYVRNWENGGISGLNFSGDPLEVKVCKTRSYTDRYDIIATNAVFKPPYYVGAGSGTVAGILATGDRSSVGFSNTPQTPPNAPPTLVNGNYYESAIWSYNSSTKELSPQWINPDGSKPSTVIAYDIRANDLFFVGDISQWNVSGSFASAVHFYLA
ncbi:hypothetical protein P691DRAFT_809886 [Macrolepiota fuliginosa MF-IS2]|uniref:Uncharacterized protein n=1 Tax=Macrolepiota fuliginosa MF-IS2 TaxID=1400762 RepID=A0A9P5XR93_9AGAR|nr:hypothetical protein P691DRAFT_809886 [Macrolepiota fuliginosa MF-IS2]